jgi:poly-gamma-glutamate synthesis protein (capsule biosynthesis protein)
LGIEVYKGKPIYYGLGNFVTVTDVDAPDAYNSPQLRFAPFNWPGTVPYWTVPYEMAKIPHYLFTETSRKTIIAKGLFTSDGIFEARAIPCFIDDNSAPIPVGREGLGKDVLEHLISLNKIEGLKTSFKWSDDGKELIIY